MHVNRGLLNWGVFFVLLGAIPLLVQGGYISHATVTDAWRLWPLILVGIGVGLLLRRTSFAFLGGLIVAATFGLMIGSLAAVGPVTSIGCGPGAAGATTSTSDSGTFDSPRATVDLQMDCGTLRVATSAGSGWSLQARDPKDDRPEITKGTAELTIRSGRHDEFVTTLTRNQAERDWQVTLPTGPELALSLSVNAGTGRVDLGGARLAGGVNGSFNAGDIKIDLSSASLPTIDFSFNAASGAVSLPASSNISGTLDANVSSVKLCVPSGVGLRLQSDGSLSSNNFGSAGLTQNGSVWTSSNYGSAGTNVNLIISSNLSSVTLNPSEGCR